LIGDRAKASCSSFFARRIFSFMHLHVNSRFHWTVGFVLFAMLFPPALQVLRQQSSTESLMGRGWELAALLLSAGDAQVEAATS
jgi:hypothetical protein